jgi:hypothetical protein
MTVGRRRLLLGAASALILSCAPSTKADSSAALPAFLQRASATVRSAYLFAAMHEKELRYIPCFCGCGADGHTSNFDCFVAGRARDGTVTFDAHGAACGTCLGIALDVKAMVEGGTPLREIRATIDRRWSAAGPSTPTPLP